MKTESYSEFLARGGKITKCPTKYAAGKFNRKVKNKIDDAKDVDWSALPAALKISFGIK
jgi:hypothetical protein